MNISHLFLRETKRSGDTAVRRIPKRALAIWCEGVYLRSHSFPPMVHLCVALKS